MGTVSLEEIARQLRHFAAEREWDQFHSPKNLAMALVAEAGELAAEFQWLTEAESRAPDENEMTRIRSEAADVLLYLTRLADKLNIDLLDAAARKLEENRQRYPVDLAKGNARKYSAFKHRI
jgi:dCTP diphosphatase